MIRAADCAEVITTMDGPLGPVHRSHVSTQNEGETEEFIRRAFVGNRSEFLGGREEARFTATVGETAGLAAGGVRSTVDFHVRTEPFDHFMAFAVGQGRLQIRHNRTETIVLAGETGFYPLDVPLDIQVIDIGVHTLQLPMDRLRATAEETAGIRASDVRFQAATPVSAAMARQWYALVGMARSMMLAADSPMANPLMVEQLTRTAAITALHTFPNTALTVSYQPGPGWVAPDAVRRAAAYIHAHADQPVDLQRIAAAAGVGGRSLQYAFRRTFDATPMEYLRRVRLERADQELRAADPGGGLTVAAVARRWGWAKPSHFTAAYRRRFGMLPSRALRG